MKALTFFIFLTVFFVLELGLLVSGQSIEKTLIKSNGRDRAYYLFVPEKLQVSQPVPLVLLLHGSGRNGNSLAEKWKDLAKKERFIFAAPDAVNMSGWQIPEDGPDFMKELVDALTAKYPVDKRRVYLFGHSAGAGMALNLSLFESEYFAATAVHAGALQKGMTDQIEQAKRKIPIHLIVGTNDNFFPLPVVRATRDALVQGGFKVELTEIKDHTHWYYDGSNEINGMAWNFLKPFKLDTDPVYETYQFRKN
jgi:poly(3-hydroxybutyrate) depolymerase